MTRLVPALAFAALAVLAATTPSAFAESSLVSSASDSVSTSSAKISDSISNSSHSSGDNRTAQGDYTVTQVAAVDGKPDLLRVHLLPTTADRDEIDLLLPRAAAAQGRVADGVVVSALARPYGIAFVTGATGTPAATREPFFLALADDTARDLKTTAVAL